MTLIPAYGRDYKSAKTAKVDFYADKDFIICDWLSPWDGKPVNKSQLGLGYSHTLRFDQKRKVTIVKS